MKSNGQEMAGTKMSTLGAPPASTHNGENIELSQLPVRPSSWKRKLQGRIDSWTQRTVASKEHKHATSPNLNDTSDEIQDLRGGSQACSKINNEPPNPPSSPPKMFMQQTDSQTSLTNSSLFSRKSFPSIFSNSTDATSISNVSLANGATHSVDSSLVKPFKRLRNKTILYLAHDDIQVPPDIREQWDKMDLDRLRTDLRDVVMGIYRKGVDKESKRPRSRHFIPLGNHEYDISFELRMSGWVSCASEYVSIGPTIWITCGSTWACKDMRAAMESITWPTLPVEIHEGRVPLPSVLDGIVDIDKLDLSDGVFLGDDVTVYFHVEDPTTLPSACGLLCCATVKQRDTYSHYFSRIGGLITTANTLMSTHFGISTAHGVLDHPWWHERLRREVMGGVIDDESQMFENNNEEDNESLYSRDSMQTEDDSPCTSRFEFSNAPVPLFDDSRLQGYRDPWSVSRWKKVTQPGRLSFLEGTVPINRHFEPHIHLHEDPAVPTDHVVVPIDRSPDRHSNSEFGNSYLPLSDLSNTSIKIVNHLNNEDLTEGPVDLLCGIRSTLPGRLLVGSTCLTIGGRFFSLRKIRTAGPLARGISGTWVVRGSQLCGMIIAVSSQESYAFMMTAEQLFSNMKASIPSIESVEVFTTIRRQLSSKARPKIARRSSLPEADVPIDDTLPKPKAWTKLFKGLKTFQKSSNTSKLVSDAVADARENAKRKLQHSRHSMYEFLTDFFDTSDVIEILPDEDASNSDVDLRPFERQTARIMTVDVPPQNLRKTSWPKQRRKLAIPALEPISETSSETASNVLDLSKPEYIFMNSTPYTMTKPTFKHGPIRLEIEGPSDWELSILEDLDNLEWTALEVATEDWQHNQDDDIDDVVGWFESWGFDNHGELIAEDEPESRPSSTASQACPEVSYSETSSDDSVSTNIECSSSVYSGDYDLPNGHGGFADAPAEEFVSQPVLKMTGDADSGKDMSSGLTELYGEVNQT
ncbi:hypothetical protein F5Y16DRAFT_248478 [Xylariaceae sp. FL0255]|nr:hypothetical protein F5Y16DRAFT_248478 [Xylariaceae sp. FL0255]